MNTEFPHFLINPAISIGPTYSKFKMALSKQTLDEISATNAKRAVANFLIYSSFQTTKNVGGSLMIGSAVTEEEAKQLVLKQENAEADLYRDFPGLRDGTTSVYYIKNQSQWWT